MIGELPAAAKRAEWTDDTGYLDVITPADPAAGANITVTIPNQRFAVLRSVLVTLTTDASVANRFLSVDYLLGSRLTAMRNAATVLITASTTAQVFQFDNQHTVSEWNTSTMIFAPLLPLPLPNGWTVQITVDSIQATDQLASCKVLVDRYWQEHRRSQLPAVTGKTPGNGTGTLSYTIPGDGLDVETVYAAIDASGAGGDVTAELTITDQSGVVIARKTQGTLVTAGVSGSATWALRLDDDAAAATPATPIVEQRDLYVSSGNVAINAGSSDRVGWAYSQGTQNPTQILNTAVAKAPTTNVAGLYLIEFQVSVTTSLNANKVFGVEAKLTTGGNDYLTDLCSFPAPAAFLTPQGDHIAVTHSFVYPANANDPIELFVINGDTAARSFFLHHANVVLLTGLTLNV